MGDAENGGCRIVCSGSSSSSSSSSSSNNNDNNNENFYNANRVISALIGVK